MPGPRRFRFTLAQLLLVAMFLALVLGLGLTMRSCTVEPFRAEWLGVSPDGSALMAGLEDGSVMIWDVDTRETISKLDGRSKSPFTVDLASPSYGILPDRDTAVTVSHLGSVTRWDLASGESTVITNSPVVGQPTTISSDGKRLASESFTFPGPGSPASSTLEVRDVAAVKPLFRLTGAASLPAEKLSLSSDGQTLAVWRYDGSLEVYDVAKSRRLQQMRVQPSIGHPVFSPDLRWAAAASHEGFNDNRLIIWDLETGAVHLTIEGHRDWISAMAFSPDGRSLAVADRSGKLRLWDVATGEKLAEQSGCGDVGHIVFSADGARLATSENRDVLLWRYGAIRLRDPATLESQGVVWQNSLRWEASFLTIGFIGWFIVWRRARRNARWSRGQPRVIPPPDESELVLAASVEKMPALPKPKTSRRSTVLSLLVLTAFVAFIFTDWVNATFELGFWWSYLLAMLFAILTLVAAFVVLVLVLVALQFIRSPSPEGELTLARRKTGEEGTLVRYGPVTAWFAGACALEQTFQQELERVRARYSQLVDRPVAIDRPLLLLCFQRVASYEAYMKNLSLMVGYYLRWPRNTIVLCEDACWEQLGRPGKSLGTLYGYYLLPSRRLSSPPGWLSTGAVALLSYDADDLHRCNRRVRKRLAEGKALNEKLLFGPSDAALARKVLRLEDRGAYDEFSTYRDQATSFVAFLAGDEGSQRRPQFRRLLDAAVGCKDIAALIRAIYGRTPGELLAEWRAWAENQPVDLADATPTAILEAIHARVLPLVRDPQAPRARRLLALRAIAQWGGPECRATLASLIRDDPADLADEAQWALETFAPFGVR